MTLNEKAQPIQWTERRTGALVAAGSLWPQFQTLLLELSSISTANCGQESFSLYMLVQFCFRPFQKLPQQNEENKLSKQT
jgi:hypothetical protein